MKFRIKAQDGTDFIHEAEPDDGWNIPTWEFGSFYLVSKDGVNTAEPADDEATEWFLQKQINSIPSLSTDPDL